MKKTVTLMTGALMLGLALNASATIAITLDENGNWSAPSGITITPTTSVVDGPNAVYNPTGTGMTTLDYQFATTPYYGLGWVQINDASGAISDLVHFAGTSPNGTFTGMLNVFVYSSDGGSDLADHWPGTLPTPSLIVTENASGVVTWAGYPPSGQPGMSTTGLQPPGYTTGDYSGEYVFTLQSPSPVPEASTMIAGMLLLLPFGASTLRILRKTQTA